MASLFQDHATLVVCLVTRTNAANTPKSAFGWQRKPPLERPKPISRALPSGGVDIAHDLEVAKTLLDEWGKDKDHKREA